MAGGFKHFGPTYKTTDAVRLGYEGLLNGAHEISEALVKQAMAANANEPNLELAGRIAAVKEDGIGLAGDKGAGAVGLFREDLNDMVNASLKASFYFRGGEYYVDAARTSVTGAAKVGDKLTTDAEGKLKEVGAGDSDATVVGVITHIGGYTAGNMYEWAGEKFDGKYIGFIMYI